MKPQNIFGDIAVKKVAEKFEIEAYPADMAEFERYIQFKSHALGGDVTTAEVFNKMIRALRLDSDYLAQLGPDLAKPKPPKKEKAQKRDNEAPVV